MAERWSLLREELLTEETVLAYVDAMSSQLRRSGVMQRDKDRWGYYFDGEDTEQMLRKFLVERLEKTDSRFSDIPQS